MVRRLNSPLMLSNPRPIAISGMRKESTARNDGIDSRASVNRRRNRNGSCAVVVRRPWIDMNTAPMPVSRMSHSSTSMRGLRRWSENSFANTMPQPFQGEPLRRDMRCAINFLEITPVDFIQARLDAGQAQDRSARVHHSARHRVAHVAQREHAETPGLFGLHAAYAVHRAEQRGQRAAFHVGIHLQG